MAKRRCNKKRRRCYTAFNTTDALAYKLKIFLLFEGETCLDVRKQTVCGSRDNTSINKTISNYFQRCTFSSKLNGSVGTYYGVNLPDAGWFQFENTYIADTGLLEEIAWVWRGNFRDDGSTLTGFQMIGKHAGNGATNNPFDISASHGGAPQFTITRAHASDFRQQVSPASGITFDTDYTIGFNSGKTMEATSYYFKDGRVWGTATLAGSGSGAVTSGGQALRVGRRADAALQFRGRSERQLIWGRNLSALEMWKMHNNPDELFWEEDFTAGTATVAASTTPSFSSGLSFNHTWTTEPQFRAGVTIASTFAVVDSRASFNSAVYIHSQFIPCVSSDIYATDIGDDWRYRR